MSPPRIVSADRDPNSHLAESRNYAVVFLLPEFVIMFLHGRHHTL
jgi:hypothetical protein